MTSRQMKPTTRVSAEHVVVPVASEALKVAICLRPQGGPEKFTKQNVSRSPVGPSFASFAVNRVQATFPSYPSKI